MPEMPHTCKHHRHPAFIGGGDDFIVTHATAWLDDTRCASIHHYI
jgi:hypothetical protein